MLYGWVRFVVSRIRRDEAAQGMGHPDSLGILRWYNRIGFEPGGFAGFLAEFCKKID
jgi:hypothetical protein